MSEAAYVLLGVIVGALAAGGVEYALRRRDERAQIRAVARLLVHHLTTPAMLLRATARDCRWDDLRLARVPMDAWREHELLVARFIVDDDDWYSVMLAFNAGEHVDTEVLRLGSDADREWRAEGVYDALVEGANVLSRFARLKNRAAPPFR